MALDQAAWVELTTWAGEPLTAADFYERLCTDTDPDFRSAVEQATARVLRRGRDERTTPPDVATLTERAAWKVRFTNLVSGRFTELLFDSTYRPAIEDSGLELIEETSQRSFLDYRTPDPASDFDLAINVKNAGVQYRQSATWVGLEPEDTLPIATYKIFGSELAGIPPLVYVYLVDWTLIQRLRSAYWHDALNDAERAVFQLLACTKEVPRAVEDAFIECTVGKRMPALLEGVGYQSGQELPFRVISAARCRRIFFGNHGRSPYVFRQRMQTDPNTHVSVQSETMPFGEFIEEHLSTAEKRTALLEGLARTTTVEVPDPTV